jgi:hypothetical protein
MSFGNIYKFKYSYDSFELLFQGCTEAGQKRDFLLIGLKIFMGGIIVMS